LPGEIDALKKAQNLRSEPFLYNPYSFLLYPNKLFKILFHPFEKAFFVLAGVGFKVGRVLKFFQ
jgi:hypothetical protein